MRIGILVGVLVGADSDDHCGSGGQGWGWTSIKRLLLLLNLLTTAFDLFQEKRLNAWKQNTRQREMP